MSTTNTTPPAPPPAPDEQTVVYNALQALITVLGMCGVAVPALFQNSSALWVLAGAILTIVGAAWSLASHLKKNSNTNLRLTAMASMSAKLQKRA